jgi:hypothetical protein
MIVGVAPFPIMRVLLVLDAGAIPGPIKILLLPEEIHV